MKRYIDADELICTFDGSECLDTERDYEEVVRRIEECETVEVEEIKHATWECVDESDNVWECSGKDGCGEQYMFVEGTPEDNRCKRCPNCGAKFDGKGANR